MSPPRKQAARCPAARAKVWLELEGEYVFGLGIADILRAVGATGSIKAAARETGKSYRHVWSRIKAVEGRLGVRLVATQVGGGDARRSELTESARVLIEEFDRLRGRVFELVEREFGERLEAVLERVFARERLPDA